MSTLQFPANPVIGDTYDWDAYKYVWDGELDPTAVGELELSWAVILAPTSLYVIHSDFPISPDHNSYIKKTNKVNIDHFTYIDRNSYNQLTNRFVS